MALETLTVAGSYCCACGVGWYADEAGPFRKAGDSLEWAPLTPDGWALCHCGEPFRILRPGDTIPPHPRDK